jgi:phage-related protein
MASALARSTGVSDDSIQAAQNMLLTFNKVANATDDGTGAFDRATKAALDLAAAGFGSVESNATQLGKALQDPIKGMTALTRSGVSFTAAEKEKIIALQESGDLLAAQEMVLKAVEGQVQGTAEASATSTAKMTVAWDQAMETIGAALLPIIDELLPVLVDLIDELVPAVMPVVKIIADLASTLIQALLPAIQPLIPVIAQLAQAVGQGFQSALKQVAPLLPPMTAALAKLIQAVIPMIPDWIRLQTAMLPLLPTFTELITLALRLATSVLPLLSPVLRTQATIMEGFARVIGTVVNAIRDLIGWAERAISTLGRIKMPSISKPSWMPSWPFSAGGVPAAAGPSTYAMGTSTRASSSTRIRVDVTGVGFDSILTGRAMARQLVGWQNRNGLSPIQWQQRN